MSPTPQQTLAAVYDEGAAAYEAHWAPALHRHTLDLVAAVPPTTSDQSRTVVDVATGSGALIPALTELAGSTGRVVALDRSIGMLHRVDAATLRVQADAAALPLATASADVVVLAFVLFLLPDARSAVHEAARVLRPGGWLLAATWGSQLGTGADVVVREELDRSGAPAFPDLARSDSETDTAEDMAELLGGAFVDVTTRCRPLDARFTAAAAVAMRTGCGTLGWRFARLSPAQQQTALRRISERLTGFDDDVFVDRSQVLLTTARRR